jgi:hypothetical protein
MLSRLDLHLAKSNRLPNSMLGPSHPCQQTCQCLPPSSYQTLTRAGTPFPTPLEELCTMSKSEYQLPLSLTLRDPHHHIEPNTNAYLPLHLQCPSRLYSHVSRYELAIYGHGWSNHPGPAAASLGAVDSPPPCCPLGSQDSSLGHQRCTLRLIACTKTKPTSNRYMILLTIKMLLQDGQFFNILLSKEWCDDPLV